MSYFTLFLGTAFIAVGIATLLRYRRFILAAKASVDWPRVRGTIVTSKLEGSDNDWMPIIEYKYQLADQSYSGDSIGIGCPDASLSKRAEEITGRYQIGSIVEVSVNPSNPAMSALEPGIHGFLYTNVVVSVLFTLLGIALWFLVLTH